MKNNKKTNCHFTTPIIFLGLSILLILTSITSCDNNTNTSFIKIKEQGSFTVGGKVIKSQGTFDPVLHGYFNPRNQKTEGQTLHGDHATVFYQIPQNSKKFPLVFWHGYGQSMRTWQTTPDGREGFQSIFLKKQYSIYLLDQPRRGQSGRSTKPITINAGTDDQLWFGIFRLGINNELYPNVQFSKNPKALNQFFRQITPDTGPLDIEINIDAVSNLFDKIGEGVLITHSHSGGQGWLTALKNENIKAIVSYEPGSNFVFPEKEVPEPISFLGGSLSARGLPITEFKRLTKIPIIIYYGDYIPNKIVNNPGQEQWRAALAMAKLWVETANKYGGDVSLVHLPEIGIKGNTHFPMSDLNNKKIANIMAEWLNAKGFN